MVGIYDAKPAETWCGQNVVGMRYHAAEVNTVIRQVRADAEGARYFDATLVLEPDNPHSNSGHAISVRYNDQVLGYLPDEDTAKYFPEVARLAASGFDVGVRARLWSNTDRPDFGPGDAPYYKLKVGVLPPGAIAPFNNPPTLDWALIPRGKSIKVTKTQEYFEANKNVLSAGDTCFLATLHKVMRGTKAPVIEVCLNGRHLGELTEVSSNKLMPFVDHFNDKSLVAVCYALIWIRANGIQVTLDVTPAASASYSQIHDPVVNPLPELVRKERDPWSYQLPGRFKGSGSSSGVTQAQSAATQGYVNQRSPKFAHVQSATFTEAERRKEAARRAKANEREIMASRATPMPSNPPTARASATSDEEAGCALIGLGIGIILILWWLSSCFGDTSSGSSTPATTSSTSDYSSYGDSGGSSSSYDADQINGWTKAAARNACHKQVEAQLKSSSTAKFESLFDFTALQNDAHTKWTLRGHVDSQNGYGATVRAEWVCTVVPTSSDNARVEALLVQ